MPPSAPAAGLRVRRSRGTFLFSAPSLVTLIRRIVCILSISVGFHLVFASERLFHIQVDNGLVGKSARVMSTVKNSLKSRSHLDGVGGSVLQEGRLQG